MQITIHGLDAVGLMIMIAGLWQMIASGWGAKELLSTAHLPSYWCAVEKWAAAQHFHHIGYAVTKEGWKQDLYELGSLREESNGIEDAQPLFNSVAHLQPTKKQQKKEYDLNTCIGYSKHLCETPGDPDKQRKKMRQAKVYV